MILRLQEVIDGHQQPKQEVSPILTLISLIPLGFDLHPPTYSQNRRHYTRVVQKLLSDTFQMLIRVKYASIVSLNAVLIQIRK